MNLKNQPTVMMPAERMYDIEREWKMSKAAWMDVAWDLMQQVSGTNDPERIEKALKERCELIQMYRKRDKAPSVKADPEDDYADRAEWAARR